MRSPLWRSPKGGFVSHIGRKKLLFLQEQWNHGDTQAFNYIRPPNILRLWWKRVVCLLFLRMEFQICLCQLENTMFLFVKESSIIVSSYILSGAQYKSLGDADDLNSCREWKALGLWCGKKKSCEIFLVNVNYFNLDREINFIIFLY